MFPEYTDFLKTDKGCIIAKMLKITGLSYKQILNKSV